MDKFSPAGTKNSAPSIARPIPDRVATITTLTNEIIGEIDILENMLEPYISSISEEPSLKKNIPVPNCKFESELDNIQTGLFNTLRKLTSIRIRLQL